MEHAVLLHGMISRLFRNNSAWDTPGLLGKFAVRRIGHNHVRRQAMGERSDFAGRSACGGLTRK